MKLPDLCLKRRIYNSRIYNNFDKITKKIKFTNPKHLIKSLVTKTSHGFAQVKQIAQSPKVRFGIKIIKIGALSLLIAAPVFARPEDLLFDERIKNKDMRHFYEIFKRIKDGRMPSISFSDLYSLHQSQKEELLLELLPFRRLRASVRILRYSGNALAITTTAFSSTKLAKKMGIDKRMLLLAGVGTAVAYSCTYVEDYALNRMLGIRSSY